MTVDVAAASPGVSVRYEDDHLAVVNKPPGLLVHKAGRASGPTLVDDLAARMPLARAGGKDRPGIVHRLDKDTSGLLIVAKTDAVLEKLIDAMKQRAIRRTYLALAMGSFGLPRGRVEAPVRRSTKDPTRMSVGSGGKAATTNFKVLEQFHGSSYLQVDLETGRTHQIRVHLAHIKHPVVGDPVYGRSTLVLAETLGLTRTFLHAARIRFPHPVTANEVEVAEPLPADLEAVLASARSG